jgi:hypothetical protein
MFGLSGFAACAPAVIAVGGVSIDCQWRLLLLALASSAAKLGQHFPRRRLTLMHGAAAV